MKKSQTPGSTAEDLVGKTFLLDIINDWGLSTRANNQLKANEITEGYQLLDKNLSALRLGAKGRKEIKNFLEERGIHVPVKDHKILDLIEQRKFDDLHAIIKGESPSQSKSLAASIEGDKDVISLQFKGSAETLAQAMQSVDPKTLCDAFDKTVGTLPKETRQKLLESLQNYDHNA